MSSRIKWLVLLSLLAVTVAGFALLYHLRLNHGDSFPPYSSMRADPLGTRLLHDSLAEIPGMEVSRWVQPLAELKTATPRTLVIAGMDHRSWGTFDAEEFRTIDRAVRSGSRVVIAFSAYQHRENKKTADDAERPAEERKPVADEKRVPANRKAEKTVAATVDLKEQWLVEVASKTLSDDVVRDVQAGGDLPQQLQWESDLLFRVPEDSPWRVQYRRDGEPVVMERSLGRGSLVLAADAYILSNEALHQERATTLLAWLIGPYTTVVFEESHLGLLQRNGIAALARKYGLAGAFAALLVTAGLFIWNRMALFIPPMEEREEVALAYNQTAGLEALLRRALTPAELTAATVEEWKRTARASDIARVDAALLSVPKGTSPVKTYNLLVRALQRVTKQSSL